MKNQLDKKSKKLDSELKRKSQQGNHMVKVLQLKDRIDQQDKLSIVQILKEHKYLKDS